MLALIKDYDTIYASAGQHPLNLHSATDSGIDWTLLQTQAQHPKVIAVGETGLDYYYNKEDAEQQQFAFIGHMQVARATRKPLIVHTRAAVADTLACIKANADLDTGGVIHCFTEDWQAAKAFLDLGFYISISGIVHL